MYIVSTFAEAIANDLAWTKFAALGRISPGTQSAVPCEDRCSTNYSSFREVAGNLFRPTLLELLSWDLFLKLALDMQG